MRRTRTLASIFVLTLVGVTCWASPAVASSSSLTITTIGREGTKVATTLSVIQVPLGHTYTVASGKKLSLSAGKYEVATDVYNTADNTDTLVNKLVSVSGATTATLDARGGVPLAITLDKAPGEGYSEQFSAQLCVEGWSTQAAGYGWPGEFFVKPTTDKNVEFGYMSMWTGPQPTSDFYAVAGDVTGLPTKPSFSFKTSSLSSLTIQARTGPESATKVDMGVAPEPESGNCEAGLWDRYAYSGPAPVEITGHIAAGRWGVSSENDADGVGTVGYWGKDLTLAAGKSYQQLFYHSAWGPGVYLPNVGGNKTLTFGANGMFSDEYATGFDTTTKATTTLSYGGHVIATKTGTDYGDDSTELSKKLTSSGWYTLTTTATRYYPNFTFPADMLSPKASVSFHFNLNPAKSGTTPGMLTRFVPTGLDSSNRAVPGATTPVNLHLSRPNQGDTLPAETAKTVQAWYSADDGTTWHAVTTTKVGSYYTIKVPDPAVGGVALRGTVTDTKGNSTTTTVYRAYSIGS